MDKVTIIIFVLIWVVSVLFKAIQKKEKQRGEDPFSFPPVPKDRTPSRKPEAFFPNEPVKRKVRIDDLYNLVESQMRERPKPITLPDSQEGMKQQSQVSLEELFIRSASQIPLASPSSRYPSTQIPPVVQEETRNAPVVAMTSGDLGEKITENNFFAWIHNLSPWKKAIIMHEIIQPPKSLRRKYRKPYS